jgi:site-specific DNA-cytosine methylase
MNVLSLFDGISCARVSLDRAKIPVKTYYACEINKHAIKVSQANYPEIVRLGDVRTFRSLDEPIDLLIGGPPCTDLSIAKKYRKGLEGDQSSLFYEYVRIWKLVKPRWFVLENVASMPKKDKDIITEILGVEPVMFNASLVSAQSRKRLFWTNIAFDLPEDRGILLKDILGTTLVKIGRDVGRRLDETGTRADHNTDLPYQRRVEVRDDDKCGTLTSVQKDNLVVGEGRIRKLTPIECERLQGLPDDYTQGVAKTHRYKCIGNAFNVDVVAHILKSSQKDNEPAD